MATATICISYRDSLGRPIGEDLRLCGECAVEHLQANPIDRREKRRLSPIPDAHRGDCSHCEDRLPRDVMPELTLTRGQWVIA